MSGSNYLIVKRFEDMRNRFDRIQTDGQTDRQTTDRHLATA